MQTDDRPLLVKAYVRGRVVVTALAIALGAATLGGCGSVYYTVSANAAQSRIEQAKQMGAETQAPFEYYYAREHLHQAQLEASQADYGDAAAYAETAELYAQKAIDIMSAGKRGETTKPPSSSGETK